MRVAWFSATRRRPAGPSDDTALLMRTLGTHHEIDAIDQSRAHDFVWRHAREPWDLCVFELGGTDADDFIAAYAIHYPGLVVLRGVPRHDRAVHASRLVVVPHEPVAQAIADDYPGVRVRTLTPGVDPLPAGAPAVITALTWPPDGAALTYAMAGFAAGRAVIVFDGPQTADWPSLDPQSWHPRAVHGSSQASICVSIDPRDEAHSLRLALRRLEADPALRAQLGSAAQVWWREHATVERAAAGFQVLLEEARDVQDPLDVTRDDGTSAARRILGEFGNEPGVAPDVGGFW